jgi:hypothetical protein
LAGFGKHSLSLTFRSLWFLVMASNGIDPPGAVAIPEWEVSSKGEEPRIGQTLEVGVRYSTPGLLPLAHVPGGRSSKSGMAAAKLPSE